VHRWGLVVVGLLAGAVGGVAWFLPWQHWSRASSLWLVPVALALISGGDPLGGTDPYTYGIFFVVVFAWIGVCHRQWTSAKLAPLAGLAYVAPLLLPGHDPAALSSAAVVVPLCVLLGEALAWAPNQMRRAEEIDVERMREMQMLLEATGLLAQQIDEEGLADLVSTLALRLLRGTAAATLLTEDRTTMTMIGSTDWPAPEGLELDLELHREAAVAMGSGNALLLAAAEAKDLLKGSSEARATLLLPMVGSGNAVGAIAIALDRASEIDRFTTHLAQTFAAQAALAFERLHTTRSLMDASIRDELTGLGNRRFANSLLDEVLPGDAVVLLDLDSLKELNDKEGHGAGDELLRTFAAFLKGALRDVDGAARYGGDEFLVVMKAAGMHAVHAVERLAEGWRETKPASTFSAGVALHDVGRLPAQTLIRADAALYRAKESGRDRVRSLEEEPLQVGEKLAG
jgi:diguanylate cyclase (GGDEF)-like protein